MKNKRFSKRSVYYDRKRKSKRALRIDTEENGWECEFETVPECGRITLTNHVNGHSNVTNWYTIEIPDNAKDNT